MSNIEIVDGQHYRVTVDGVGVHGKYDNHIQLANGQVMYESLRLAVSIEAIEAPGRPCRPRRARWCRSTAGWSASALTSPRRPVGGRQGEGLDHDRGEGRQAHRHLRRHAALTLATELPVYFAHPHSPWERPTKENTNGA